MKKFLMAIALCLVCAASCFGEETDICNEIYTNVDDFTGEIEIGIPHYLSPSVSITKYINGGKSKYRLYITIEDSYCTVGGRGLYILFTDGTKFIKPNAEIDCDYYGYGDEYTYSSFVYLTPSEVKIFSQKEISKYKMYIFEGKINNYTAEKIKEITQCIITKNGVN